MQFSTSFNLFEEFKNNKEIHKINEKNGLNHDENEFNDEFHMPTDWHLFDIKSEGDHIIIIHPISVSIIKIEIINDTHARLKLESKGDQLKSSIKISYMKTIISRYLADLREVWGSEHYNQFQSVEYRKFISKVPICDSILDSDAQVITLYHSNKNFEQVGFKFVRIPNQEYMKTIVQYTRYMPATPYRLISIQKTWNLIHISRRLWGINEGSRIIDQFKLW